MARHGTQSNTTTIPSLTTVLLTPEYERPVTQANAFLKNIETVEITHVEVIDNVLYFVIDIYTEARCSQIPTVVQRKQTVVEQSLWRVWEPTHSTTNRDSREPALTIKRSLAAFQAFQKQICLHLEKENRGNCHTCNAWMTFTTFAMAKSTLTMNLVPITTVRKRELGKFLKAAVLLAIQATVPTARRQKCHVGDTIALSTSRFLQTDGACS